MPALGTISFEWPDVPPGDGAGAVSGNSYSIASLMTALETAVQSESIQDLPRFRGELKRLDAMAELRMITGPRPEQQRETTGKPTLLTAQQVAERLNVKKSFVYEVARQKKLRSVRLGEKYVMFTESAVDDFLTQGGA